MALRTHKDRQNFTELYKTSYSQLYGQASRFLGNKQDAEEIVHDVYVKFADNYNRYRKKTDREKISLLVVMTRNACINLIRKKLRHGEVLVDIIDCMAENYDNVQAEFIKKYRERCVKEAMDKLKVEDRDILVLKYYHEMTYAEIGRVLSLKNKNVEIKLRRARRRLESLLSENAGEAI